jgi:hypothetical protein
MTAVGLWSAFFFAVLLVTWLVLKYILKRCSKSKFVYNFHNGVYVLARKDDYDEARHDMKKPDEFVMFPNCMVFFDKDSRVWADKNLMLGDADLLWNLTSPQGVERKSSLFVPHVSSRFMPLEKQEKYFRRFTLEEAREYLHGDDSKSFMTVQWQRLIHWSENTYDLGLITFGICALLVTSLLVAGISDMVRQGKEQHWEAIVNTSADNPKALKLTAKTHLVVISDDFDSDLLSGTITSDPVYMGGNLVSVEYASDRCTDCAVRASATMNLKKGDKIIVRTGRVMNRKGFYSAEAWVITQSEADALIATEKFHYYQKSQ